MVGDMPFYALSCTPSYFSCFFVAVVCVAYHVFVSCVVFVQAQRDFFGAHTYERVDKEGTFHCLWDDTHKDIGDVTGRIAGEL